LALAKAARSREPAAPPPPAAAAAAPVDAGAAVLPEVTVLQPFDSPAALELEMRRRLAVSLGVEPTAGEVREAQDPQRKFLRKGAGKQAASYGMRFKPHAVSGSERHAVQQQHVNAATAARRPQGGKGYWDRRQIIRQSSGGPPLVVGAVY
jgi:hypothetical protein